jgi:hypothetical protein
MMARTSDPQRNPGRDEPKARDREAGKPAMKRGAAEIEWRPARGTPHCRYLREDRS